MPKGLPPVIAALTVTGGLLIPAATVYADPPPCEPGAPGCKTGDDPEKRNPKFTQTQRGNLNAPGTEGTCVRTNPGGETKDC